MVPIVHRGGTASAGIVTVAELLSRNVPAPRPAPDDDLPAPRTVISVGSLLRREGRAPHALDRPVQPRTGRLTGEEEAAPRRSVTTRRVAAAAGTLLAAGSVLGAAVLTDASSGSSSAQEALDGSYPGTNGPGAAALPGSTTVGGAHALDSGTAAPVNWMAVAFPSALPAGAATAPAAGVPGIVPGATVTPVAGSPGAGSAPSAPSAPVSSPGAGTAPSSSGGSAPAPSGPGIVSNVAGAVNDVAQGVAQASPPPLQRTVSSLGDTVGETGNNLGNTMDAGVDTVQKLAAPVTKPVTGLLAPPTSAAPAAPAASAASAASPLSAPAPEPVLTTVTDGVGDVAQGTGTTVGGAAGGLTRTVGGLLG